MSNQNPDSPAVSRNAIKEDLEKKEVLRSHRRRLRAAVEEDKVLLADAEYEDVRPLSWQDRNVLETMKVVLKIIGFALMVFMALLPVFIAAWPEKAKKAKKAEKVAKAATSSVRKAEQAAVNTFAKAKSNGVEAAQS